MMNEEIPEGLQKKNLKYRDELKKTLPNYCTVSPISYGWSIRRYWSKWFPIPLSDNTWLWWHSMEIETGDEMLYQALKKFGDRHEFKKIIKKFS